MSLFGRFVLLWRFFVYPFVRRRVPFSHLKGPTKKRQIYCTIHLLWFVCHESVVKEVDKCSMDDARVERVGCFAGKTEVWKCRDKKITLFPSHQPNEQAVPKKRHGCARYTLFMMSPNGFIPDKKLRSAQYTFWLYRYGHILWRFKWSWCHLDRLRWTFLA